MALVKILSPAIPFTIYFNTGNADLYTAVTTDDNDFAFYYHRSSGHTHQVELITSGTVDLLLNCSITTLASGNAETDLGITQTSNTLHQQGWRKISKPLNIFPILVLSLHLLSLIPYFLQS